MALYVSYPTGGDVSGVPVSMRRHTLATHAPTIAPRSNPAIDSRSHYSTWTTFRQKPD
ncbi:MAG: hypothetical protein IJ620_02165 [Bacteroidales bacterium]|nr:hypothetical protein [Bacteroidales bacterium]